MDFKKRLIENNIKYEVFINNMNHNSERHLINYIEYFN